MRRAISIAAVIAACAVALVLTGADGGGDARIRYEIVFDNVFGLVEGGDFKVGGVKAGQTTGFELTKERPHHVVVSAEVTEEGFDTLRSDSTCAVRQQSLIGEYFVDCESGRAPERLADGGRIPVERTSSTIPPDLINTIQRRPYRERFRLIIAELGAGLAGRPEDLNEVIRRAHPGLREVTETLAILRQQNRNLADFIKDSDTISASVAPRREDVARWAREARDTSVVQASRSEQLAAYWNRLPDFLDELEPTMAELERTADAQIPTLRKLTSAAPKLTGFLADAAPFAKASREGIDDLGRAAGTGARALRRSREEVKELRRLASDAPGLGRPLRQFLQTIDDRKRATERDPQADGVAPPAPDKTARGTGPGFTGMEGILNYVYYQALGINAVDEFGHLLRIAIFTLGPCSPYSAKPTPAQIKQCASWTGPYQPGVNAPDPTRNGVAAAERREATGPAPTRAESQARGPGEPEAPPVAGQRDLSQPQIKLPSELQDLLDDLSEPLRGVLGGDLSLRSSPDQRSGSGPRASGQGRDPGSSMTQLLDYLLGS